MFLNPTDTLITKSDQELDTFVIDVDIPAIISAIAQLLAYVFVALPSFSLTPILVCLLLLTPFLMCPWPYGLFLVVVMT